MTAHRRRRWQFGKSAALEVAAARGRHRQWQGGGGSAAAAAAGAGHQSKDALGDALEGQAGVGA
jgi:hypothetical protein